MPYANPEIYGAPETWQNCFYAGGSTQTWAADLHGIRPKVPHWIDPDTPDDTTYKTSQLRTGIAASKITAQHPIDKSICPIGQGDSAPFRHFAVYAKIATEEYPNGITKQIGTATTAEDYDDNTTPVNMFWYEANCPGASGNYGNRAFSAWKMYIDKDQKVYCWSPDGEDTGTGTGYNGNFYVAPFTYYETRSFLIQICVYVTNAVYDPQAIPPTSEPEGTWRTLDDWKNNYSNHTITGCQLRYRVLSAYNANTGIMSYYKMNYGSSQYRKVGCALADELKFEIDDGTPISDICSYGWSASGSNSDLGIRLFGKQASLYKWSDNLKNIALQPSFIASYVQIGNGTVFPYIPYSDGVYESIMAAAACFGVPFTPAKSTGDDSSNCQIHEDFTDEDLCLPIIDSRGVAQGDYSRGAANLQNSYYYLKSVFDYEPIIPYYEDRPNQISVYDINEPQNGFEHNGLAILMPMECISDKEEQGRWDLTLVHPIDDYGKWTYIIIQNVLKVNGQLFRIDETEIYQDAEQAYVTAHAKHITYDLYDRFVDELTGEAATANEYIYQVIQRSQEMLPTHQPEPNEYFFSVSSNITGPIIKNVRDQTVIGALFGDDNSLASRYGGHLYRDNFRISINTTQEGAPTAPAFKLRFGTDLTKISYKIDCSEWITELICKDNFGDVWAISYTGSTWIIHHQKTRIIHFTYDPNTPDPYDCLTKDGFAYWQTVSTPTVSIEVSVANLKNDPKYKDFVDLQNLDVGYEGNVYIEQYGIDINLKIVSIRRDELTGEALQVVLGTSRGSFIRSPVMSQTVVANGTVLGKQEAEMQAMKEKVDDISLNQMRYWRGMKIFKWVDAQNYTWEEIINGRTNDTL